MSTYISGKGVSRTIETKSLPVCPWDTVIHRGYFYGSSVSIENTMSAFKETVANGYKWAECDIRFTSDGVPVLCHDTTFTASDSTTYTIASSTYNSIKDVVIGTSSKYGSIKIATLEELLKYATFYDLGIVLDIKIVPSTSAIQSIAKAVLNYGRQGKVIYMPLTVAQAQSIIAIDRHASFDFVRSDMTGVTLSDYSVLLTDSNTVAFDIQANASWTESDIKSIHDAGMHVSFWNVAQANYQNCMAQNPLRITKRNDFDATDLDALYLASLSV